jgi:hypothetical protein
MLSKVEDMIDGCTSGMWCSQTGKLALGALAGARGAFLGQG